MEQPERAPGWGRAREAQIMCPNVQPHDEPLTATLVEGQVVLLGGTVAICMTPEAALETACRLFEAASRITGPTLPRTEPRSFAA